MVTLRFPGSRRLARHALVPAALVIATPGLPTPDAEAGKVGIHVSHLQDAGSDKGRLLVGGHLEVDVAPFLSVAGSFDYRHEASYDLVGGELVPARGKNADLDLRLIPVTASARVYLPRISSVTFFGAAGLGVYRWVEDVEASAERPGFRDSAQSDFGWHLGYGADFRLSPTVSIFGEHRVVFLDESRSLGNDTLDRVEELDYDSTYLSAGLNLHF